MVRFLYSLSSLSAVPDVDLVVAAVDEPRIKVLTDARQWTQSVMRWSGALNCQGSLNQYNGPPEGSWSANVGRDPGNGGNRISLPPPLFSSTVP